MSLGGRIASASINKKIPHSWMTYIILEWASILSSKNSCDILGEQKNHIHSVFVSKWTKHQIYSITTTKNIINSLRIQNLKELE